VYLDGALTLGRVVPVDSTHRRSLILSVACMGFFMVVLDTTVVSVALPKIGKQLGGGISGLQWVVDGYTLFFGTLVLSAGHLSDRVGARLLFRRGIILFAVSSAACGVAPTLGALLIGRACQGAAAALMLPSSLALVGQAHADPRDRARAIGIWAAAGGAAVAAGPVLGGVLTDTTGWRTVFLVNLPIAIIALIMLAFVPRSPSRRMKLDLCGQVTLIVAVASLTLCVIESGQIGFGGRETILAVSGFVVASAMFVIVERRASHPIIPLRLLSTRGAAGTIGTGLALYFSFYGVIFELSLFFQRVLHESPISCGLMFIPMTGLVAIATLKTASWSPRVGSWVPLAVGLALMLVGLLALLGIDAGSPWWKIGLSTIPVGVGAGIAGPAIPVALLAAIPAEQAGIASGVANAVRQVAATLGVAIFGTLLSSQISFVQGMQIAFFVSACMLAVGLVLALVCVRPVRAA
jgi:DHA2 family methylenomycin A resistance protein-like MFS transporter